MRLLSLVADLVHIFLNGLSWGVDWQHGPIEPHSGSRSLVSRKHEVIFL